MEVEKPAALADRGGVCFAVGEQQLHVGAETTFRPARKAHPALRFESRVQLDDFARRLADAGLDFRWDRVLQGRVRFYVDDPWGNRLELLAPDLDAASCRT